METPIYTPDLQLLIERILTAFCVIVMAGWMLRYLFALMERKPARERAGRRAKRCG